MQRLLRILSEPQCASWIRYGKRGEEWLFVGIHCRLSSLLRE